MADDNTVVAGSCTFQEDPLEYCKQIYAESMDRNDDLRGINEANRLFYEGEDDELDKRAADKDVVRSSLFIHELKPAIDTRVADIMAKLEERENPVVFRPANLSPTAEDEARALGITIEINEQLRDCGYLSDGFHDHILSAEIYRSPATVKVGWENVFEKGAVVSAPSEEQIQEAALVGKTSKPRVVFEDKYKGGRPYVELLPPDQFLYEPSVSRFQRDSDYAGHPIWVSWGKLMSIAHDRGWDVKLLDQMKEELATSAEESPRDDTIEEDIKEKQGPALRDGYRDGKYLIVEFTIRDYDEDGTETVNQVTMVALKLIVENKRSPYKGLRYPYVPIVVNPFPGSIEGLSSVDITKSMQRLYNELFNQFLDGVSYRIFPPLVREPGTDFQKRPKWAPGQIWDVSNSDGLRPLIENPGVMPDLPSLMAAIASKIRETLNAHDISQGFQSQEYEKATATSLRASGANRRALPVRKRYGEALIRVAEMFLALNQQYNPNAVAFAMPLIVDVPSLTEASDPETERQDSILILSQAMQLPMYQTPTGQQKIRNMMQDVVQQFKKIDVPKYVPTEEELHSDQEAQAEAQLAALEKQNAEQGLAVVSQGGQR